MRFRFRRLAGGDIRLAEYAGRPLLVVNTASLCGYTPQYAGLQELWTEFHDRGLMIIGVPSNDFGGQEPGGATEIAQTAQHQYGVTFPDRGEGRREGRERASVLQMGGGGAAEGCSALELPQIPDRPRRLYRRSIPGIRRTNGYAGEDRHCAGAGGFLTASGSRTAINRSELTCSLDKSAIGDKRRVAVAAQVQLGYMRWAGSGSGDGKSRGRAGSAI
jgi:hypothetical protein